MYNNIWVKRMNEEQMIKVATAKRATLIGGSYAFIIDKAYIKNGQISKKQKYDVFVMRSNNERQTKKIQG